MQGGGGGGRDSFFHPFGSFGGFQGFGGHGSLVPNVFGGRSLFEDPFLSSPFGGSPFRSMFESSFDGLGGSPFIGTPAGFFEHQHPMMPHAQPYPPQSNLQRGPIIEELDSDDERAADEGATQWRDNPRMHSRSGREPFVQYPDAAAEERRNREIQIGNDYNRMYSMQSQPQSQSFSFHSSSVTYGGGNGSYYTKSSTRRTGSDGVTFEEHKEADSTTGQALHQVSRGIYDKGHTLTRNLHSDGKVDNMQTLHNLNQDELAGFEETWKGKAKKHLPAVIKRMNVLDNAGANSGGQDGHTSRGGWALPSTQQPQPHPNLKRVRENGVSASDPMASQSQYSGRRIYENGSQGRA